MKRRSSLCGQLSCRSHYLLAWFPNKRRRSAIVDLLISRVVQLSKIRNSGRGTCQTGTSTSLGCPSLARCRRRQCDNMKGKGIQCVAEVVPPSQHRNATHRVVSCNMFALPFLGVQLQMSRTTENNWKETELNRTGRRFVFPQHVPRGLCALKERHWKRKEFNKDYILLARWY